ncbi:MAG: hydrogenase subunit MbhD domain-containing protein [Cyanobacteria bacterium J06638_7]
MTLGIDLPLLLPITALLPLTAILVVLQSNPYQTLVMRGILGAVAALIYALLGAADVALTEALVGTLLSTTLYAVALRSSMVLRLGRPAGSAPLPAELRRQLEAWLDPLSLRLELVEQGGAHELHGLLEWQQDRAQLRLLLHSPRLLQRLAVLPRAGSWGTLESALQLLTAGPDAAPASGPEVGL